MLFSEPDHVQVQAASLLQRSEFSRLAKKLVYERCVGSLLASRLTPRKLRSLAVSLMFHDSL